MKNLKVAVPVLFIAIALAGCSGGADAVSKETSAPPTESPAAVQTAESKSVTATQEAVEVPKDSPIVNVTKPEIAGKGIAGSVQSTSSGSWNLPDLEYTYQWYADGEEILGANRPAYRPTQEKTGAVLTVEVTATSEFTSGSAISDPTAPVLAGM